MRSYNSFIFKVICENVCTYHSYQVRCLFGPKGYEYEIEVITLENQFARVDCVFNSYEDAMTAAHRIGRGICDLLNRTLYEKV